MEQYDLLSYWVIKAYDPSIEIFCDVYKSYGKNVANKKLIEYLSNGVCAIIEYRTMPMI
jgi:hypothetical protein